MLQHIFTYTIAVYECCVYVCNIMLIPFDRSAIQFCTNNTANKRHI